MEGNIDLEKVRLAAQVKLEIQIRDSLAAELTRANAKIEELTSQNLELSKKYDDCRKTNTDLMIVIDREFKAAKLKPNAS